MAVNNHDTLLFYLESYANCSFIACSSHVPTLDFAQLQTFRLDHVHQLPLKKHSNIAANHTVISIDELLVKQILLRPARFLLSNDLSIDYV
jgi:hypothetical protein